MLQLCRNLLLHFTLKVLKERLQQIEKDQENYELVEDELDQGLGSA